MRDTVDLLVFDGFADWQTALALCEVRRPGDWRVRTVGLSGASVMSMSGLRVQPDVALTAYTPDRTALLIVPGGHLWHRDDGALAADTLRQLAASGATVAGIDSGVLALARAGLLDRVRHTGNWAGHIKHHVPHYVGAANFQTDALAVSDGQAITASHLGSIEFAREIIKLLKLYSPADRHDWFRLFKHAQLPAEPLSEAAVVM